MVYFYNNYALLMPHLLCLAEHRKKDKSLSFYQTVKAFTDV